MEKEFDVRVNKEGDYEEVILREVGGVSTIVFRPEGGDKGFFKSGRAKGVFTMIESPAEPTPVVPFAEPSPPLGKK